MRGRIIDITCIMTSFRYTWSIFCVICAIETQCTWYHCHQMPMQSLANKVCLSKLFWTLKPVWTLNSVFWNQYTWVMISPKCLSIHYFNLDRGVNDLPEFWQLLSPRFFVLEMLTLWHVRAVCGSADVIKFQFPKVRVHPRYGPTLSASGMIFPYLVPMLTVSRCRFFIKECL